mmetsp:Transcript_14085/g.29207  ORF Transcript_14085/g.29207 Transcript_14085/m.29207 type:complete len:288 (+) Transcript_14085:660-1523(+)
MLTSLRVRLANEGGVDGGAVASNAAFKLRGVISIALELTGACASGSLLGVAVSPAEGGYKLEIISKVSSSTLASTSKVSLILISSSLASSSSSEAGSSSFFTSGRFFLVLLRNKFLKDLRLFFFGRLFSVGLMALALSLGVVATGLSEGGSGAGAVLEVGEGATEAVDWVAFSSTMGGTGDSSSTVFSAVTGASGAAAICGLVSSDGAVAAAVVEAPNNCDMTISVKLVAAVPDWLASPLFKEVFPLLSFSLIPGRFSGILTRSITAASFNCCCLLSLRSMVQVVVR